MQPSPIEIGLYRSFLQAKPRDSDPAQRTGVYTSQEIPPFTLAFLRFALASLLMLPLARRHRQIPVAREDRRAFFLLGFVGGTLYFGFKNFGLKFTTTTHGALIVATIPLTTEAANAFLRRRLPRPLVLAGLLIGLTGVVLLVGPSPGEATLPGDLLMLAAGAGTPFSLTAG